MGFVLSISDPTLPNSTPLTLTPKTLANLKPVRDKSISDPVVGAAGSYHQPLNIHLARPRLTRRFHVISTQDYARFSTARCKSMQQMELKDYFRQRHKFDIFRFSSVWLGRREREGIDQLRPGEQILPFHRWWRLKGPLGRVRQGSGVARKC